MYSYFSIGGLILIIILLCFFSTWLAISISSLLSAIVVYHTTKIPLPCTSDFCTDTAHANVVQDTICGWSVKVTSHLTAHANLYLHRRSGYLFSVSNRSPILHCCTYYCSPRKFCTLATQFKNNEQLIGKKTRQWSTLLLYQTSSNLYFSCIVYQSIVYLSKSFFSFAAGSSDDCFHCCMQVVCSIGF